MIEGELTGFVEGMGIGVEIGLVGVIVTGLEAGTVMTVGVELSGGIATGVVDGLVIGVVGKNVVGGSMVSSNCLWEEGNGCSSL